MFDTTNRVKDEKNFDKTITARYKMSNTKNKDFVKIVLLDMQDISNYFDFELLCKELNMLDFHIINFEDTQKYIGVVKNYETRQLCSGKLLKVSEYL